MTSSKVIKRYANRKLYDTERSCYVTLDDIATMIKAGEEVKVVDNKTGEDLSSVTLAQIIFEAEKKKSFMPINLLRDLVKHGGDTLREQVDVVQARASDLREHAQKLRSDLEGKFDRLIRPEDGDARAKILTELFANSQKAIDELQKGIEDRIKGVSALPRAAIGKELEEIRKRFSDLKQRLGKY